MKPILLKTFSAILLLTASPAFAWEAKDLAGKYELTGVMEMAGLLVLAPDQKYQAGFSYGAADWVEEGTWKPDGDGVVLAGSRIKVQNTKLSLFLPAGTHLSYKDGKLTAVGPGGKVAFVDPNKTPSNRKKTGEAGEGRMLVNGKVMKVNSDILMVKIQGECVTFASGEVSPDVMKTAKKGATLNAEIPFSAILSGETCPPE